MIAGTSGHLRRYVVGESELSVVRTAMDQEFSEGDKYEPWLTQLIEVALSGTGCKTVLDVGANVGFFSIAAACMNPQCRIYAFEPLPVAYDCLLRNIESNGIKGITARNIAIGAERGTAEICLPENRHLGNAYISGSGFDERGVSERHRVSLSTLSDIVAEERLSVIDVLKIDAEGSEEPVLVGGEEVIRKFRPITFIEFNAQITGADAERRCYKLWRRITRLYDYVFMVRRIDGVLVRVRSYSQLRLMMLTGSGVEDLVGLFDEHLGRVQKLIGMGEYCAYESSRVFQGAGWGLVGLNMFPDGWIGQQAGFLGLGERRVSMIAAVYGFSDTGVVVHIYEGGHVRRHTIGQTVQEVRLVIDPEKPVFLWAESSISAATYWNNADPRTITTNWKISRIRAS